MGLSLKRIGRALITGGASEVFYEPFKDDIQNFFGKEDRANAREYASRADEQVARGEELQNEALGISNQRAQAEGQFLSEERDRFNNLYSPIEEGIASDLADGPRSEEMAQQAGNQFANEFDASTAARTRQQQRLGVNYRPGSSQLRMQGENDAYNRARGIAGSATEARREEDDRHFLRSTQFFNSNGSGIRNRLLQGMDQLYGADYASKTNSANQNFAQAGYNQGVSNQFQQQSTQGLNTVLNLGGRVAQGIATGGASEAAQNTRNFFGGGGLTTAPKP